MGWGIFLASNFWRAFFAFKVSLTFGTPSSVSEEELLGVDLIFITLSWLGLFGKGMAGFFASSSSFRTTISKAVLSLEWLGLVGRDLTRGCLGVGLLASFLVGLGLTMVQVLVGTQNCLYWP